MVQQASKQNTQRQIMRAWEFADDNFLLEIADTKITKQKQYPTKGLNTFADNERWSSDYVMLRVGMAAASTDGKTPPNIDAKSWAGKNKTAHPYTKQEQDMLKQAYKAVGAKWKDLNHGDLDSQEIPDTNTKSPVTAFKGYPR